MGGFPFRLDANFSNFGVHGAGAHGPFGWSTEKFALHALTYGPAKAVYEAAGRQQVNWTDAGGTAHDASFLPGSLRASSILDDKGLSRADLDIVGMGAKDFTIGHFQFHMRRDPDGADLDLMLKADAAGSPQRSAGLCHLELRRRAGAAAQGPGLLARSRHQLAGARRHGTAFPGGCAGT